MVNLGKFCAVVSLVLTATSVEALAATTFDFEFDNGGLSESPPAIAPFVGSGTVTIANDPGNGTFALTSLGGFSTSFTLGTDSFSDADIATPLGEVLVVLSANSAGQQLQFSNQNPFGDGPYGGSIDFVNSDGAFLTFEPPSYGGLNLYSEGSVVASNFSGNDIGISAVPLPGAFTMFDAAFLGLVLLGTRKSHRVLVD